MDEGKKHDDETIELIASPENSIPKFCNKILLGESDNNVILTFLSAEKRPGGSTQGVIAGRYALSRKHAESFLDVFSKLLKNNTDA